MNKLSVTSSKEFHFAGGLITYGSTIECDRVRN